jgi:protoporphyrinogen oxidase
LKPIVDIVGAGISGLASAHFLARSNKFHIRVWEKDSFPGGLAGSFNFNDEFVVEKFYHHIFKGDTALLDLIKTYGLHDKISWRPANTGSFYFNQPYRLSSPIDLLKFKPLPFISRIRMGLMVVLARRVKNWHQLDTISAEEYILKTAGRKVYERVWQPLLKGKFGKYATEVSAAWLWSKFVDRGSSRSKGGHEVLGYLRGGLGTLFEAIVKELENKGHEVHLNTAVQKLKLTENKISEIETEKGTYKTDYVINAAQVPDLTDILPKDNRYATEIGKIQFLANVCLVLTLKKSLSNFYWTNVTDPEAPFVGIIEQTNWVDKAEYNNRNLVYISSYVPGDDAKITMTSDELIEFYLPHIQKMFPTFTKDDIISSVKWTAPYTQPIVSKGYRHLVPSIKSSIDNLFVCTMAQIYPNDRQVSNGVEMAEKTVQTILHESE